MNFYIIPTPIGNLEDLTLRSKNILSSLDFLVVENKNVFSTISSSNSREKFKEWESSVCHRFVTRITLLKKSMISIGFNIQNQVVLLSGNSKQGKSPVIETKKRFPSGFPQKNVCYYGFKHIGITAFMTASFLGTIEWE